MYNTSEDTLDIIESPSFEKPSRLSLKRLLYYFSQRSHRVVKAPGMHSFRVWLNNKPILSSPFTNDSESEFMDQVSDDFQYEPFRTVPPQRKGNARRARFAGYSKSLRNTVRNWFHADSNPQKYLPKDCFAADSTFNSHDSNSTLTDNLTDHKRQNRTHSPMQLFDGPTALM
ncbi:unnamed protein product [Kluyveromyces dobzhanskii CBS 2104]|uniref:WGS project CCBQ000000000 data, contig 00008 n=1 Tax=Kluyveromyces dobzhanskii CBS 2104 TaxID=1427455 RepID=A0A0A8L770_9SACH|nr:unnamed protein product [Kluyveromyces dobzhanskii CBS 2104]